MEDNAFDRAGELVYSRLDAAEKATLMTFLDGTSVAGGGGDARRWREVIEELTRSEIARRVELGEALDLGCVVDAVMPAAMSSLPDATRSALFHRVRELLALRETDLASTGTS